MYYYLSVTDTGSVYGYQSSPLEITDEAAGSNVFLETPEENSGLLFYRYLGTVAPGVTVLGANYLSQFEAPPSPDCYWDGSEWVCPGATVSE